MVISKHGIRPKKEKLEDFMNASIPSNSKEVKSFLSLAQYFQERIPNLANISAPLRIMLTKFQDYNWGPKQQEAFLKIKTAILLNCLGHFDDKRRTEVWVDAGPNGVAAYIIQSDRNNKNRTLITCGSHAFSEAELNYSQVEKEGYACVWACEHFHIYLYGQQFDLYSDNKSMVHILEATADATKRTPLRLVHWKARLVRYNLKAFHIPGLDNIADYLSRCLNLQQLATDQANWLHSVEDEKTSILSEQLIRKLSTNTKLSFEELQKETANDPIFQELAKHITSHHKTVPKSLQQYSRILPELSVSRDNFITRGTRILLPSSLASKAIDLAHKGHLGINSMKRLLRRKYFFLGLDAMVEAKVASCQACCVNTDRSKQQPLAPTVLAEKAWDVIDVDYSSKTPSGDYAMLAVCERSRFPAIVLTRRLTADAAIKALRTIFSKYGVPSEVKSDNGPCFISAAFKSFTKEMGFKHRLITPLWPPANGLAERFMRNINKIVRCALVEDLKWTSCVNDYLLNYRNVPHSGTGLSPNEMMGFADNSELDSLPHQVQQHSDTQYKARMKQYTDKKRNAKLHSFKLNDVVVHKWSRSNKYQALFDPDEYIISAINGTMITAYRSNHQVTRNASFFQSATHWPKAVIEPREKQTPTMVAYQLASIIPVVEMALTPEPTPVLPADLNIFDFLEDEVQAVPPAAQNVLAEMPLAIQPQALQAPPTVPALSPRQLAEIPQTVTAADIRKKTMHFDRSLAFANFDSLAAQPAISLRNRDVQKPTK